MYGYFGVYEQCTMLCTFNGPYHSHFTHAQSDWMQIYFPTVYDIKYLMKFCDNLHGGLNKLAEVLQVERIGPQHQVLSSALSHFLYCIQAALMHCSVALHRQACLTTGVSKPASGFVMISYLALLIAFTQGTSRLLQLNKVLQQDSIA